jgi:IS30 family transposase
MTGLRLTVEQRRMIRRLSAEGLSLRQVARQVSCSHEGVSFVLRGHQSRVHAAGVGTGSGSPDRR